MKQMTYWHYTFIKSAKFNGELNFGWGCSVFRNGIC